MTSDKQIAFTSFCRYLDQQHDNMLADWQRLVNLEGRADEKQALEKTAAFLKDSFERAGLTCEFLDVGPDAAPFLTGVNTLQLCEASPDAVSPDTAPKPEAGPGAEAMAGAKTVPNSTPVLFAGHYDTVFLSKSRGEDPFRIEGGKAYGPGVLDMKGGIIITLYIAKAIKEFGLDIPLKIAFCGDEESGHVGTCSDDVFAQQAKDCRFAFNMETGFEHRALCTSRKGTGEYEITVRGVSSHPGNAFLKGKNAIEEMAHKVIALQQITAEDLRYTVSVNTITGGTGNNIIPDICRCVVDLRGTTIEAIKEAEQKLAEVCAQTHVAGTVTTLKERTAYMPPFEKTEGVARLLEFVQKSASLYGLPVPDEVALGGSSDASYIGSAGANIPVLCSCGACGALSHTEDEYALTGSLAERAKLFFAALLEMDSF